MVQSYRNNRQGYYTDCQYDTTPIGALVPNLKSGANSYDHDFIPFGAADTPRLTEFAGNAYNNGDDPAYTHEGYLYCDGTEYNILDYPILYEVIGNDYGGRASTGIDVTAAGSGYTVLSAVTISAPPTGGVQATAEVESVNGTGGILAISVINPGSGYVTSPTVTVAGGTSATFVVRLSITGGFIQNITSANVMSYYGDQYMGTFKVPDTVCRKIVGNGPVFGANSPTIGNESLAVGVTGGKWYLDQSTQDNYFSLGRITTTGYDKVIETTSCTIIGSQTVKITMEDKKIPSIFQHQHAIYHTVPGNDTWVSRSSGDRYLRSYDSDTGKTYRFDPTTGEELRHNHALLRQPIVNTDVATYDFLDYKGGDGGIGAIKDVPDPGTAAGSSFKPQPGYTTEKPYDEQYYLASGDSASGSIEFVTTIPNPTLERFSSTAQIGGRKTTEGGQAVYDYSQEWEYTSPGSYQIPFSSITGTPTKLIYTLIGGGGSGAAGNIDGNDGQASTITAGSTLVLNAGGGSKGGASSNNTGGGGGNGGVATESGSLAPSAAVSGFSGTAGANDEILQSTSSTDPGGGGTGGTSVGNVYSVPGDKGKGSNGCRVLLGGLDGVYDFTFTLSNTTNQAGTFNFVDANNNAITNASQVEFWLKGGRGGDGWSRNGPGASDNNNKGGYGALLYLDLNTSGTSLVDFFSPAAPGWNVCVGAGGNGRLVGNNYAINGADGGYGGLGSSTTSNQVAMPVGAHGGGGGAVTVLRNGTAIVAGAAGGGGGAGDGMENWGTNNFTTTSSDGTLSAGTSGGTYPGGEGYSDGLQGSSSGTIGVGSGGQGGQYGCVGGGGGGGGAGVSSGRTADGQTGQPYGLGGAPGGPGGEPGAWGGHFGGRGGRQGLSEYKTTFFGTGQLSDHTEQHGSVRCKITYNNNKWTAAGGGGGSGSVWRGDVSFGSIGSPSTIDIFVGSGGSGISTSSPNTGSTNNANGGYAKIGVGVITGYTGGVDSITPAGLIESASQSQTVWDVTLQTNGVGTGTGGNFILPTGTGGANPQLPTVLFRGGGKSNSGTITATGYDQTGTGHAQGTVTATASGILQSFTLSTTGGTNTGYTEKPYVYFLHGCGGGSFATCQFANVSVSNVTLDGTAADYAAGKWLKFGGEGNPSAADGQDRWVILKAQDMTYVNYFSIKACRGNGVNGGDVPEEGMKVEYQLPGTTTWTYIDTIINPSAIRNDPLSGMAVPACGQGVAHDGTAGATKWYTYSVAIPAAAQAASTKIRLYQQRAAGATENAGDKDHYGICEFIYHRQKATIQQFTSASGEIRRNTVDFLEYNVQGETGAGYTYSSGLGCGDATLTMKSTTKIEPQATIDPDYDVPLISEYVTTKYLIKAF